MSGGYEIKSKSGMTGKAGELDRSGDDTGKVRKAVDPAMCYVPDALGGNEAAAAFNAYATAWESEAGLLERALHELAGKVDGAKGAYAGTDHLVATSVHGTHVGVGDGATAMPARAGNDAMTTMPTPAGDSIVSTPSVHADRPSALSEY
ncbi:hypothetical protein ACIGW3_04290 [Streptomyces sp. NPDC053499]|uniref:hypothetical protein n=1 Tax=Streptomyces sp. NPDC053499 TaxID=3365707 RepID=UPI0037D7F9A4